jgi:hypothetical protein
MLLRLYLHGVAGWFLLCVLGLAHICIAPAKQFILPSLSGMILAAVILLYKLAGTLSELLMSS